MVFTIYSEFSIKKETVLRFSTSSVAEWFTLCLTFSHLQAVFCMRSCTTNYLIGQSVTCLSPFVYSSDSVSHMGYIICMSATFSPSASTAFTVCFMPFSHGVFNIISHHRIILVPKQNTIVLLQFLVALHIHTTKLPPDKFICALWDKDRYAWNVFHKSNLLTLLLLILAIYV